MMAGEQEFLASFTSDRFMNQPIKSDRSVIGRLLAMFDRVPGLGGGRTHFVFLGVFFAVALSCYLTILKLRGEAGAALKTWTEWDALFPFSPWWIWVYLIPYILGPLLVMVLSRPAFEWYVRRGLIVIVVSLIIFFVLPTQVVRNPSNESRLSNDLTSNLYRWMVKIDTPPANAAPSLHVSLSCLLAWVLAYDKPRYWPFALFGALVVWVSVLCISQHHLIDVATGALLASLAAIGRPPRPLTS
jgi:hypothetical protein